MAVHSDCAVLSALLHDSMSACVCFTAARALFSFVCALVKASAAFCVLFCRGNLLASGFDFCGLLAVFFLDQIEIALGGDGGRVGIAQRAAVLLIGCGGAGDFLFELCLPGLCFFQPLGVVTLPVMALLQLIAGLLERALALPTASFCKDSVRLSVSSLAERPVAVFSKFCTPALASLKEDCASWICFWTERMLRVKLSLFSGLIRPDRGAFRSNCAHLPWCVGIRVSYWARPRRCSRGAGALCASFRGWPSTPG